MAPPPRSAPPAPPPATPPSGASKALTLSLVGRIRDVPQAEWDALALADPSPFVEWTWLDCLEEAGCVGEAAGWLPVHFVLRREGALIAVAPGYAKTNSEGEFVFDWSWADLSQRIGLSYYPKLVLAVPFTPAGGGRLLIAPGEDRAAVTRAVADAIRGWATEIGVSSAHVLFPPEEEAAVWQEAGFETRLGVQYHWRRLGASSFDEYLSRFNSKRRNQLKRESSQPFKDGVAITTLGPGELTPDVVKAMFTIYATNVDKHFYGRRYLNPRFFELVAQRFAHRLAWVVARKDGQVLAGAFNAVKGKRLYGRYWGTFVDMPFLHFNVCYYHGIRECLERGIDLFEPGAGGEHKKARGFDPTITYSAHWIASPKLRGPIVDFVRRERDAIRAYVASGGSDE
jgi:predicted N-acyltransferase